MNLKRIMLNKEKAIPLNYVWYDSIYITCLKWQNYRDGEELSDYYRLQTVGAGQWEESGVPL